MIDDHTRLPRHEEFPLVVDSKQIAQILCYTTPSAAANLCRSGQLKTAQKKGAAWVADRDEVFAYRDKAREYIKNRVAEMSRRGKTTRKKDGPLKVRGLYGHKRGRPPKPKDDTDEQKPKRPRGRPRKQK